MDLLLNTHSYYDIGPNSRRHRHIRNHNGMGNPRTSPAPIGTEKIEGRDGQSNKREKDGYKRMIIQTCLIWKQ